MNPSWEIVAGLPSHLPPLNPKEAGILERPVIPPVRIWVHPAPVRVSYRVVRNLVPKLWECTATREDSEAGSSSPNETILPLSLKPDATITGNSAATATWSHSTTTTGKQQCPDREEDGPPPGTRIDLVVHVGMAGPRRIYWMEQRGHRDGYRLRDVDGEVLGDSDDEDEGKGDNKKDNKYENNPTLHQSQPGRGKGRERDDWPFRGTPPTLTTAFDAWDVHQRWSANVPFDTDVRLSTDAGHYLCDFIYFSSLAWLYRRNEHRRVVFLHVPSEATAGAVRKGRAVTLGLIRALVESSCQVGYRPERPEESEGERGLNGLEKENHGCKTEQEL